MEKRKSFIVYLEYRQHLELLSDSERGQLFTAMLDFAETGTVPMLDGMPRMAFSFIKAQMERDAEKYNSKCERNRENGAKGGRPVKPKPDGENPEKPKITERFSKKPKKADNDDEDDNEDENEDEDDIRDTNMSSADDKRGATEYGKAVEAFNEICPSLPKVRSITAQRRKAIKAAAKMLEDTGGFPALFRKVEASDFLTGRNGGWNGCGFDWIIKPANLTKILEGNYDNRAGASPPDYTDPDRYKNTGWGEYV